jgi:integrase
VISDQNKKEVKRKAEFGDTMQQTQVIQLSQYRKKEKRKRRRPQKGKSGSVFVKDGKLWVDFRYLGQRVRQSSGLNDTKDNRKKVRNQLDLIIAKINNGEFEFAKCFPKSKRAEYFTELEGRTYTKRPCDVLFEEYVQSWIKAMELGWSSGQRRDYLGVINYHLLPFFAKRPFSEFTSVLIKKFLALLKSKKNRQGNPLSAKRIRNIMIPLRNIVRDAFDEHGWHELRDPFNRIKLPKPTKHRARPFNFKEWEVLISHIPDWYQPYFNFAVHTGLRPSEQVALKWIAIDDEFIHIELSRVNNQEKADLKTDGSRRSIELRPTLTKILEQQHELTKHLQSPYVFLCHNGYVLRQNRLWEVFKKALLDSGLPVRRMYETRHTFASWALAAGETPAWVARTLGHVDTTMVYRNYVRYIPNLTHTDGTALEKRFSEAPNKKGNPERHDHGHDWGHDYAFQSCQYSLTI